MGRLRTLLILAILICTSVTYATGDEVPTLADPANRPINPKVHVIEIKVSAVVQRTVKPVRRCYWRLFRSYRCH